MYWIILLMIMSQPFGQQIKSSSAQQLLLALGQEQPSTDTQDADYWYNKGRLLLEGGTGIGGAKGRIKLASDKLARIFTVKLLLLLTDGEISFDELKKRLQGESEEVKQNIEEIESYYSQAQAMLKEAIDDFDRTIELDSKYTDAYLKKADSYLLMNMKQEAAQAYKDAFNAGFDGLKRITLSGSEFMDIAHQINNVPSDVSVTFSFVPEDEDSPIIGVMKEARTYLIPKDENLSGKALTKYYIVSIPIEGKISIKLASEMLINKEQSVSSCTLPPGEYTCIINIPDLHIQSENQIPFRIRYLSKDYEDIFPSSDNQAEMTLESLEQTAAEKQGVITISCSKDNFTRDNRVKKIKSPEKTERIPIGHYKVKIEIPLELSRGQEYNFSIVPLSSPYGMLLKKLWWAPLLGAAITSIIGYFQ